jgi:hypothetical protein
MSISRKIFLGLPVACWLIPLHLNAQYFSQAMSSEALRPFWDLNGFNTAMFSLNNNVLLATDISSSQSNPAFLSNIHSPKACLSVRYLNTAQKSMLGIGNSELQSNSSILHSDYFGFAYPVPVYQGSLVLALSYTPSAYYNSALKSKGNFNFPGLGNVYEEMNIKESGALNTLRLAGAVEFLPNFNFGASLNFHGGNRHYQSVETENEDQLDTETDDYPNIRYLESIKPEYSGFNMDFGLSFQSENLKFGLRLSTPLKMTIHELSEFRYVYSYDDGSGSDTTVYYDFEYNSRYPLEIAPSFGVKLGNFTLGLDFIIHNWRDVKVDLLDDSQEVNRDLYWNLRRTTDVGLSLAVPVAKTISTRFAYRLIPSPYEDIQNTDEEYNHLLGGSIETIIRNSLILGCSYQRTLGKQTVPHSYFGTYSTQSYANDLLALSLAIIL